MLAEKTYIVRFSRLDGNVEVVEWTTYGDAKDHFNTFDASDADIYTAIALIERNWENNCDYLLESKVF